MIIINFNLRTSIVLLLGLIVFIFGDQKNGYCISPEKSNVILIKKTGEQFKYITIQQAIDNANPGDTVTIPKGVWHETIRIRKTANSAEPIIIKGEDRNASIIDGSTQLNLQSTGWKSELINKHEINSIPYVFKGSSLAAWNKDGVRVWTFINPDNLVKSEIGNNNIGVYYDNTKGNLFTGKFDSSSKDLFVSKADYTVIIERSSNIQIENLTIRYGGATSLRIVSSNDLTISNVTVNGGRHGIYIKDTKEPRSSRIKLINCLIKEKYSDEWYWSDFKTAEKDPMEGAGIFISSAGSNNEINDCEIEGYFDGIAVAGIEEGMNNNLLISGNRIHDILDDAIEADAVCSNCRIFNNVIYDCYTGLSFAPAHGSMYVYRNIVLADKKIRFKRAEKSKQYGVGIKVGGTEERPSQDVNIYNNTIIAMSHVLSTGYQNSVTRNFKYLNNIFYSYNGTITEKTGRSEEGNLFDWNLYYRQLTGPLLSGWQSGIDTHTIQSLSDARYKQPVTDYKWELNGIQENPLLSGPFNHPPDVNLMNGSHAFNKGADILELGWPDSLEVMDGMYDIGAVEKSN